MENDYLYEACVICGAEFVHEEEWQISEMIDGYAHWKCEKNEVMQQIDTHDIL